MATKAASKKEKWSPGCCTNAQVVTCELRGKGNWSRYHAILDDEREIELRRVTGVLDLTESKALVQWSANETAYHIQSQLIYLLPDEVVKAAGLNPLKEFDNEITGELRFLLKIRERDGMLSTEDQVKFGRLLSRLCDGARFQANRTKNTAAEWGTMAHGWIEKFLKHSYWPEGSELDSIPTPVFNSLRLFAEWWSEAGMDPVKGGVEVYVWDMDLGIGGTVDLIARDAEGKLWAVDWKTGTGLYSKNILQMAAYCGCLVKRGYPVEGAILANIGREHGIPQFRRMTLQQLRPAWNFFRDLALGYEAYHSFCSLCEAWNKEHKEANERRMTATASEAAGTPGGHLEPKEFFREFCLAVKKKDKRVHSILTDCKPGAIDGTGFEMLLPLGFEWHMGKLEEAREVLAEVAVAKSGIAAFEVRLRYDNR